MPNLTTKLSTFLFATSTALCLTAPSAVFAQAPEPTESPALELEEPDTVAHFAKADLDGDEQLSEGEYEVYINSLADSGDITASDIRDTGTYANGFITTDLNGDGVITRDELG